MRKFKRILVANRGEIAIRIFRACQELGIRTIGIYTEEDKGALFRSKADEAYQIGKGKGPVEAYLNIEEIIHIAKTKGADAIHPGYGFLAENREFAKRCEEEGLVFIGPTYEMIDELGDKVSSKKVAKKADVPTIPGVDSVIKSEKEAFEFAKEAGYPVMLKAAAGGGGRGMRLVEKEEDLIEAFHSARNEAVAAFGDGGIFIEKYLKKPKHIEVQILGDNYGNLVHLYERDCSIQRRHQKVIEYAPAFCLTEEQREAICEDALKIAKAVNYRSAGTVEFLLDADGQHYFIEMNPRIQVEHTVTEVVTGVDIVQSQLLLAQGFKLDSEEVDLIQDEISTRGYAIQCRVTTEDPTNVFAPDTGQIEVYRTDSGAGIRLDGGTGFTGAEITPYYDSLLVKVTSYSRTFKDAVRKASRSLNETVIEGVKTNIGFLINVLNHEEFLSGNTNTGFITYHPEVFDIEPRDNIELNLLKFIGDIVVNNKSELRRTFNVPKVPEIIQNPKDLRGTKQILDEKGPKGLADWVLDTERLLITDTTMRDAHQSLMATRMRTKDMTKIAEATSVIGQNFFSLEMWGGATFDVAYRFLNESPWERLRRLRELIPNLLFQMLIRGANAVGYKNYPDNTVQKFIKEAADGGIDVFRVFDSLNWMTGMEVAMDAVLTENKVAEGCLCYTGDILDTTRDKYSLKYYVDMAKKIEKMGAHILGIKDMSALLKPYAAEKLVKALKNEISIPIHLHTHDTTGNGVAASLTAIQAGVDIVDGAFSGMSGLTSQPSLNSVVAALENTSRDTGMDIIELEKISSYWEAVRPVYAQFESDMKTSSAEIYRYEIPGGQYSNLKPQVESFGLGHRFNDVKEMFLEVNEMVGDIVKVTPSSKFVGDMAIFMVQNDLTKDNILEKGKGMSFPDSAVAYFQGMMGQPEGGFPKDLQKLVLGDIEPITVRPGELLEPEDFDAIRDHLSETMDEFDEQDVISYAMYPQVFEDYQKYIKEKGDFMELGSDIYFHGLDKGEAAEITIGEGKKALIKLIHITNIGDDGTRGVVFELNGNRREVRITDVAGTQGRTFEQTRMADASNPSEVGANIPGKIFKIVVEEGEEVKSGDVLIIVEAMKMEMNITAPHDGVVETIHTKLEETVSAGELLLTLSE